MQRESRLDCPVWGPEHYAHTSLDRERDVFDVSFSSRIGLAFDFSIERWLAEHYFGGSNGEMLGDQFRAIVSTWIIDHPGCDLTEEVLDRLVSERPRLSRKTRAVRLLKLMLEITSSRWVGAGEPIMLRDTSFGHNDALAWSESTSMGEVAHLLAYLMKMEWVIPHFGGTPATALVRQLVGDEDILDFLSSGGEWVVTIEGENEVLADPKWKALLGSRDVLSRDEMNRVWGDGHERKRLAFLSHRSSAKGKVAQVREYLESEADMACFVAHEDIIPSEIWQNEILNALKTMHVLIAFVTDDFHGGGWPDQEVGYAYCRDVPRVSVKLGAASPVGMLAREQALTTSWERAGPDIISHLEQRCI